MPDKEKVCKWGFLIAIMGFLGYLIYKSFQNEDENFNNSPATDKQNNSDSAKTPSLNSSKQTSSAPVGADDLSQVNTVNGGVPVSSIMGSPAPVMDKNMMIDLDGTIDDKLVHNMYTSKSCCHQGYLPKYLRSSYDPIGSGDFVPTNFSGGYGNAPVGCSCVKKYQFNYIAGHGNNKPKSNYVQLLQ